MNKYDELAQRLYDLIDPWDCDYATKDDFIIDLQDDPIAIIEYLLDRLDDLQEGEKHDCSGS